MRRIFPLPFILAFVGTALADPVTPPEHSERDFRAIGGNLFVKRNEKLEPDDGGNITVGVLSHDLISAGEHYSFDLGLIPDRLRIDAGSLGELRVQFITVDCAHGTYQVFNMRRVIPQEIWRPASSLPVLAPVFNYACSAHRETAKRAPIAKKDVADPVQAARQAAAAEAERAREAEAERIAAAQRRDAELAEIWRQAAARDEEMPVQYREARKRSSFGARLFATGFMQIPVGGSDGACSRLLVANGWSKPLADVACHEQTVKECAASLTTESVSPSDMPLVSTAVGTSTDEVCAHVRAITNPTRAPKP
jgi:hypothetical protein